MTLFKCHVNFMIRNVFIVLSLLFCLFTKGQTLDAALIYNTGAAYHCDTAVEHLQTEINDTTVSTTTDSPKVSRPRISIFKNINFENLMRDDCRLQYRLSCVAVGCTVQIVRNVSKFEN